MEPRANHSEVTRLLQQINEEYASAQAGLAGSAITAQHRMITARTENIGRLHEELHALVGNDAMRLIAQQLDTAAGPLPQEEPVMSHVNVYDACAHGGE